MIKKYLISYTYTLGIIIIGTFMITLLNYFNLLSSNLANTLKLIIVIVSIFVGGFLLGKKSNKKGYLEGIKYSVIFILFLIVINLIIIRNFDIKSIIYFLIIIGSSTFGSMIGINKKRN